jgi:hypothetical protein
VAQREIVASLQDALDARRQRIILSGTSINWVKWAVLLVQACLTLVTIAMVHSGNRAANRIILGIFATGVGVAIVLIAAHCNPFMGEFSVSPSVLLQVIPEASPAPLGTTRIDKERRIGEQRPATLIHRRAVCGSTPVLTSKTRQKKIGKLRERNPEFLFLAEVNTKP